MARSKIGPALALWATSFLAAAVWTTIGWGLLLGYALEEASNSADPPTVVDSGDGADEVGDPPSDAGTADETESSDRETTGEEADDGAGARTGACGNLTVNSASSSCGFANNVFYEYWTASDGGEDFTNTIRAYSSAIGAFLELTCVVEGGDPVCRSSKGAEVQIPRQALADYTSADAEAYAASHRVTK